MRRPQPVAGPSARVSGPRRTAPEAGASAADAAWGGGQNAGRRPEVPESGPGAALHRPRSRPGIRTRRPVREPRRPGACAAGRPAGGRRCDGQDGAVRGHALDHDGEVPAGDRDRGPDGQRRPAGRRPSRPARTACRRAAARCRAARRPGAAGRRSAARSGCPSSPARRPGRSPCGTPASSRRRRRRSAAGRGCRVRPGQRRQRDRGAAAPGRVERAAAPAGRTPEPRGLRRVQRAEPAPRRRP